MPYGRPLDHLDYGFVTNGLPLADWDQMVKRLAGWQSDGAYRVDGQQLRRLRHARCWTQEELARRSGYSERLIRKAEAGQPVAYQTVATLSQTLSIADSPVAISDIVFSPAVFIARWWEEANGLSTDSPQDGLISDRIVVTAIGQSGPLLCGPLLCGRFEGASRYQDWMTRLRAALISTSETCVPPAIVADQRLGFLSVFCEMRWPSGMASYGERIARFAFEQAQLVDLYWNAGFAATTISSYDRGV